MNTHFLNVSLIPIRISNYHTFINIYNHVKRIKAVKFHPAVKNFDQRTGEKRRDIETFELKKFNSSSSTFYDICAVLIYAAEFR